MGLNSNIEVLGVGAAIVDRIIHVSDNFLASVPGRKGGMETVDYDLFNNLLHKSSQSSARIPGGSCANVIRGLASLGHSCALLGKIGNDDAGDCFIQSLRNLNIVSFYTKSHTPTGQTLSLFCDSRRRTYLQNLSGRMR